ncbi:unnamed protein product [Penicillium olsonii]|uniref:Uncharacterized protein n=1 Tax=Penicillium olsonii TaxID=99116 RepID=A0A9W4HLI6_PENOL|nr:unnamed protein product [Penicillium olsonii]
MAKPPHSPIVRRITQSLFPPHPARIAPVQPSTLRHGGASSRPFHTTPIRSGVRRSPGLRRAESKNVPGGLVLPHTTGRGQRVDRDGFWWARLRFDLGLCLRQFDESANTLYEHTTKIKLMPPGVSFKTFKSVAEQLIRLSHAEYASHGSIKTISTDADAVYRIACCLLPLSIGPNLREWAMSACAKAKSRRALVDLVNKYIEIDTVDIHRNTEWIAMVKDLALIDEFPPAIMLYAKILTWRGENEAAAQLLQEKILPYIRPSPRRPDNFFYDLTVGNTIDSPLRLYGLAIAATKGIEDVSKVMERAALEFYEPIALTELAITKLELDDHDRYEELMTMGAASGYGRAAFYLANYYFRISQGEFLTRQEREEAVKVEPTGLAKILEPFTSWLDSIVNKPWSRMTYRELAKDWYAVAATTGNPTAELIYALMMREESRMEHSRELFDLIKKERLLAELPPKAIKALEQGWNNPEFEPEYPIKFMPLG